MKKAILILVIGLFWFKPAQAEVIKYNCNLPNEKRLEYANFTLDTDRKTLINDVRWEGQNERFKFKVLDIDNEKVKASNRDYNDFMFYYATDQRVFLANEGRTHFYSCSYDKNLVRATINKLNKSSSSQSSSSSSSSTDDKIAQAKQICKDLGFKTKTEKFADCSLKMLSMQFEVQNRETSSDGGTQQKIVVQQGYSVGDAMIALSGIISDANNVRSSYGGGNCRIFQHAYHASLKCN